MTVARQPSRPPFVSDAGGNVSIMFALAAVPLLLVSGAAIDYARTIAARTALQQAVDATALAVAHDLGRLSDAAITAEASRYFQAASGAGGAWIDGGPVVSPDRGQVCLKAREQVKTLMMPIAASAGLAPTAAVGIAATSCARVNASRFEVALALDNSGSMAEATSGVTKMDALKTAARDLVAIMDPAGQLPRTSFSVVPFSSAVNVGANQAGATWMDRAGASSIHWQNFQLPVASYKVWVPASKFDLFDSLGVRWGGCVEERPAPYTTSDAKADTSNPDTLFVPYLWPDEGTSPLGAYRTLKPLNTYLPGKTGGFCSTAVQANADTYATADAPGNSVAVTNQVRNDLRSDGQTEVCKYRGQGLSTASSAFKDVNGNPLRAGPNLLCSSRALTSMSNDVGTITAALDAMTPDGDTNLVGGFMWGWRTISPNGPFGGQPPATTGPQNPTPYGTAGTQKVVILMTDGFNHWSSGGGSINGSAYSSFGYFGNARLGATSTGNYRGLMDDATQQGCSNAKAAGVTVYTVGFTIPSDPIDAQGLAMLKSCASDPSMAYVAQDGTALIATFRSIANQLSGLRLVN